MASRPRHRHGLPRQAASRVASDLQAVASVDPDSILSDPKQAEALFRVLQEADSNAAGDSDNPDFWRHMFEVTRAVLKVKGEDAILALEALRLQEETSAEHVAELERQLTNQKGGRPSLTRVDSSHQQLLQEEIAALEKRNTNLEQHLRAAEVDLSKERSEKEWFKQEFQQQTAKMEEMTRENQNLQQAAQEYQNQLSTYRVSLHSQRGYDAEERERQKLHNVKLSEELDQMRHNLLTTNEQLSQERDSLAAELESATRDMIHASDEIARLKAVVNQSDENVQQLRNEKDQLIAEMTHKEQAYQEKSAAEEAMMAAIDKKVDEWKQVLDSRNAELAQCKEELAKQQHVLYTAESDKTQNVKLAQIASDREEQIDSLQKQLAEQSEEVEKLVSEIARLKTGEGNESAQQIISELEAAKKKLSDQALHDRQLREQAFSDASEKDQQLSDALAKVNQLVQGVYGLPEALKEIEGLKQLLSSHDKETKELVGRVNHLEDAAVSLEDENSELCKRLGIDRSESQIAAGLRYGQRVTNEQEKAKARQLAREVERLEQERIDLKHQLLVQAMHRGERAVQLNLTTDDLIAVEEYADLLREAHRRNEPKPTPHQLLSSQHSVTHWKEELQQRDEELQRVQSACRRATNAKEIICKEKADVEAQLKAYKTENTELSKVLKDVMSQVKRIESGLPPKSGTAKVAHGSSKLTSTALEELLALWHSRHGDDSSRGALVVQLRAQVEQLVGKSAQLQEQLTSTQAAHESLTMQLARKDMQIDSLQADMTALRHASTVAARHEGSKLPGEIPLTSAEIISTLNKQLLHTLNEDTLKSTELALSQAQSRTAAILHQQALLYEEYSGYKASWQQKETQLKEEKARLEERHEHDQIAMRNFKSLKESLKGITSQEDQQSYIVELSQRVTELEISRNRYQRQLDTVEDERALLQKDHELLKYEFSAMEEKCKRRITTLQVYRIKTEAQLASLHQQLEETASMSELQSAQSAVTDITAKYRVLLSEQSQRSELQALMNDQKAQIELYQGQLEELQTELYLAKEKALKAEHLLASASMASGSPRQSSVPSQSHQQVALLEMKALSAEQKAELAQQKLKQSLTAHGQVEERNAQLEKHFEELTKLNLEAQQREQNLSRELEGCIPSSEAPQIKDQINSLLETEAALQAEVQKLQSLLDLAHQQHSAGELQQTVAQLEVASLRSQLRQLQAGGDEKATIGKLHRQVVALEVREAAALHKLHQATAQVTSLEAMTSKLQEEANAKAESLYQCKVAAINKQRHLRNALQVLRRQYAGCVPLAQQEQFAQLLKQTKLAKLDAERKLKEAKEQQVNVDDQLAELQLRLGSVQDLVQSLKDGTHASKVVQWHGKMEEVRLENLRHLRQMDRMKDELTALKAANHQYEENASMAEESLVSQQQRHETEAMAWECREAELEGALQQVQLAQEKMLHSANELASSGRLIPNPSEPVSAQLEQAVRRLKEQAIRCASLQDKCDRLEVEKEHLKQNATALEQQIVRKEKIETELRIRLTGHVNDVAVGENPVSSREKEAVALAQNLIESLKEQLQQKESSLLKYQTRLVQVQEECASVTDEQKEKIVALSKQLQSQKDELFKNLKQAAVQSTQVADPPLPTQKQLARLQELEDVAAEQDQTVVSLTEKIAQARADHRQAEEKWARSMKTLKQEMKKQAIISQQELQQVSTARQSLENELSVLHEQFEVTQAELASAKEAAHHAPSKTMKVLVDKLKQQLSTKESQHQALTQALAQLRADMTSMAEQQIKEKMANADDELNIQRLIDAQTMKLKTHVEDLQARLSRLTSQAEKQSKLELTWKERVAELQEDVHQKDLTLGRQTKSLEELRGAKQQWEKREQELLQQIAVKQGSSSSRQEMTQLRARCKTLQSQVERQNSEFGKLQQKFDTLKAEHAKAERLARGSGGEVQRWEETKRLQQRCESLQKRLKDKEKELESSAKQVSMLKDTVTRLERERNGLQQRAKRLSVQSGAASDPSLPASMEELEKLRQQNARLENEVKTLKARAAQPPPTPTGGKVATNRLQAEIADLKKRLAKDGAECEQLRVVNGQLEKRIEGLTTELLEASRKTLPVAAGDGDTKLQEHVESLQTEVARKNRMLQEVKRHLKGAAQQEQQLQDKCDQLESEITSLRATTPASTQQLVDNLQAARAALHTSEGRHSDVLAELNLLKKKFSSAASEETAILRAENEKMRAELAAFDPQFFQELEDLKQNYQHAMDLNKRYEEQLRMLSTK